MHFTTVIIALVNGMVDSTTLILPIISKQTGIILSPILLIITGILSFCSCYFYILHLGNHSDMDTAITYHFS